MSTSPFRWILIPVEFTDDTDLAVHSGLDVDSGASIVASTGVQSLLLAAGVVADGGALCLVHATPSYETARVYTGGAGMGIGMAELAEVHANARAASMDILQKLVDRYASNVECSFVVRPGTALNVILEEATRFDADLIVIPASGRSRVARFFLGSTTDRVIREAPCPVLVVPPLAPPE